MSGSVHVHTYTYNNILCVNACTCICWCTRMCVGSMSACLYEYVPRENTHASVCENRSRETIIIISCVIISIIMCIYIYIYICTHTYIHINDNGEDAGVSRRCGAMLPGKLREGQGGSQKYVMLQCITFITGALSNYSISCYIILKIHSLLCYVILQIYSIVYYIITIYLSRVRERQKEKK